MEEREEGLVELWRREMKGWLNYGGERERRSGFPMKSSEIEGGSSRAQRKRVLIIGEYLGN